MKSERTRLVIAGVLVAAALVAWRIHASRVAADAPGAHAELGGAQIRGPAVVRPRVTWPAGACHRYALGWSSSSGVTIAGNGAGGASPGAMTLALDIDGELVLCAYGTKDDRSVLTARFERLRQLGVEINGKPIYPDLAAATADVGGHTATFEVDADGTVQRFAVDSDPSGLFRHLMRGALLELQLTVPRGTTATWDATEHTVNGTAGSHYTMDPALPGEIRRSHVRYDAITAVPGASLPQEATGQNLKGSATIVLGTSGLLDSLVADERLTTTDEGKQNVDTDSHFALRLMESAPFDASAMPSLAGAPRLSDRTVSANLQRRMLDQRIDGLTFERVQKDLTILAAGADIIELPRWIWRATGLLISQPELSAKLADIFSASDVTAVRALVVDLLASAGHPQAQAAMRAALSSQEAAKDASLMLYVQRFSFVHEPTRETMELLWTRFDAESAQGESKLGDALLYTLGSATGHLRSSGEEARAQASHARLALLFDKAATPHGQKVALAALGNAGFPEDVERIRRCATDENVEVRSQAAWSLRKLERPELHATMLALVGDTALPVQTSAIQVLSEWSFGPGDAAKLDDILRVHPVDAAACVALVALLGRVSAADPHVRAIYEALLARGDLDSDSRATIHGRMGSRTP